MCLSSARILRCPSNVPPCALALCTTVCYSGESRCLRLRGAMHSPSGHRAAPGPLNGTGVPLRASTGCSPPAILGTISPLSSIAIFNHIEIFQYIFQYLIHFFLEIYHFFLEILRTFTEYSYVFSYPNIHFRSEVSSYPKNVPTVLLKSEFRRRRAAGRPRDRA